MLVLHLLLTLSHYLLPFSIRDLAAVTELHVVCVLFLQPTYIWTQSCTFGLYHSRCGCCWCATAAELPHGCCCAG